MASKTLKKYIWVAEPGACEKCMAMNGTEYDDYDDVPDKLHPNCKCKIAEVDLDNEALEDNNESPSKKQKILETIKEEIQKILKQIFGTKDKMNEGLEETARQQAQLDEIKNHPKFDAIQKEHKAKIKKAEHDLASFKFKGEDMLGRLNVAQKEVDTIKIRIEKNSILRYIKTALIFIGTQVRAIAGMVVDLVKVIYANRENIKKLIQEIAVVFFKASENKVLFDIGVEIKSKLSNEPDAVGTYQYAADKLKKTDYIKSNGSVVRSVDDIDDKKTTDFVKKKIQKQMKVSDSKGVIFHENSSLAKNIVESEEFQRFISGKSKILYNYGKHPDARIEFKSGNLYHTIHYADIIDLHLEKSGDLFCKVIDTVEYNPGDPNWLVRIARQYQEDGRLTPYYFIVEIRIPLHIWNRF